ncbi:MAG: DNA polymerase III subunit gamma/tau [Gammaproteobacteria bacterium]|nr:DNA polymerase III subunit gamma/tau [Gammaproteobacteria bacterium]
MTYQVLARKWRPGKFSDLAGQSHVLKPLTHALDNERLHHAYLFTGTRGVGKTTLARILAKCLNCEQGVSSEPCGTCSACTEITEGRFVDLIEVDAASRTKVEDTRELLENVQYAPTLGRFKIYLIDEVHMLSTHSFNALLKTLEEPPPHVKFLLATTDPQKLPVTILSRCLQFNLKNLSPQQIEEYLEQVLKQEKIKFEEAALWQLASSAAGSMRDALTLLDQAISFCEGKVEAAGVSDMIGTPEQGVVFELLDGLANQDTAAVLQVIQELAERGAEFQQLLESLLATLHRLAIAQVVPDAIDNSFGDRQQVLDFADRFRAEDLQLFYQFALKGRGDLSLALDTRAMFEMLLIRMLVFVPEGVPTVPRKSEQTSKPEAAKATVSQQPAADAKQKKKTLKVERSPQPVEQTPQHEMNAEPVNPGREQQQTKTDTATARTSEAKIPEHSMSEQGTGDLPASPAELDDRSWIQLCQHINPGGITGNILAHCVIMTTAADSLELCLDSTQSAVYSDEHKDRIAGLLGSFFGQDNLQVAIEIGEPASESPAAYSQRLKQEALERLRNNFQQDDNVQKLVETFSGEVVQESISPLDQ